MVYSVICNVSWVLKRTVSTKRLFFVYSNTIGPSVRLEAINNFLIQLYLQPNSFYLKLLKAHFEMSETRALRVENSENLNGSLFVDNQLRKGMGFEIWDRLCAKN